MRQRWPKAKSAIVAAPLHEEIVAGARGPLQLVFAAVALVLLVACVNVANLTLVRATGRVQEFAVRAALGSGRSRLTRQLLVESLVLACLGGVVGLALADAGIRMLEALGQRVAAAAERDWPQHQRAGLRPRGHGRNRRGQWDRAGPASRRNGAGRSAASTVAFVDRHSRTRTVARHARCRASRARADAGGGSRVSCW